MTVAGVSLLKSYRRNRVLNRQSSTGRDTRPTFVETDCAPASAFVRGSVNVGSTLLIVNGSSGSSLLHHPRAREPVTCVRRANFVLPAALNVCRELDGQRAIR